MAGFCKLEVKMLGPIHEYVVPPVDKRFNVLPAQTGLLLFVVTVGWLLSVTVVVAVEVQPILLVTVTV